MKHFAPEVSRSGHSFIFKTEGKAIKRLDILMIVKLQALIRRYLQMKKYRVLVTKLQQVSNSYFKREEFYETLSNQVRPSEKDEWSLIRRHDYKTGAMYVGEWKGGFR